MAAWLCGGKTGGEWKAAPGESRDRGQSVEKLT